MPRGDLNIGDSFASRGLYEIVRRRYPEKDGEW